MSGQSSNGSTLAVRFEIHAGREVAVPGIKWIRGKENLDDCQRAYIEARDKAGLGHSQFGSADVFTDSGHHIAHISYNGRVWSPRLVHPIARCWPRCRSRSTRLSTAWTGLSAVGPTVKRTSMSSGCSCRMRRKKKGAASLTQSGRSFLTVT